MLFDLTAPGRRRTVKITFLVLAVLFVAGTLIGVGSGYDLGEVFGSGGSPDSQFERDVENLERRVRENPQDAAAWARLAEARYQAVTAGGGYDQNAQQFTAEGRRELRGADQAWQRYLALDPPEPNADTAALMVNAYTLGLNDAAKATEAQEIVVEARPSAAAFQQLAQLAYLSGQTRKGDLAAERALDETPRDMRETLRDQLEAAKQQGAQQQGSAGAQPGTGGAAPPGGSATGE